MSSAERWQFEREARDESRRCSGYFGAAQIGASLTMQRDTLWNQYESVSKIVRRAFAAIDATMSSADGKGVRPAQWEIDAACEAFDTQLQILSAATFDGYESIASFIHHDKVELDNEALD